MMIDPSVGYRNVGERLRRVRPEAFVGIHVAHLARVVFGWGPRRLDRSIVVGSGAFFPGPRTLASLRRATPPRPRRADDGPDDPASVLYTTGSTGPATPALYTHRNFCGVFRIVHQSWAIDRSDGLPVDMAVFPAFFIVGLSAGGTVVVPPIDFVRETPATADPAALLEAIEDCQVTSLFGSPVLLENLARYANARGITTPSHERVIGGGAPITGPTMRAPGVRERVTATEAIAARLDGRPRRKEGMSNEAFAKIRQEARDAQAEFVRAVMREADQLLVAASKAYRVAKSGGTR
jgi:olefin beta-lactone synthetase